MAKAALITAWDVLAVPDEPTRLDVELERRLLPFLDPPIRGSEVEAEGVGRARTDAEGRASFELGRLAPGTYRFRVRPLDERYRASAAEALVRVVPRETPILVTDIDHTIADVSSVGFVFRSSATVRPMEGAPEALRSLAERLQLVYLTARDHIFADKTKDWLRHNGFPEAPLYLRKGTRFGAVSPGVHKIARLAELRACFPEVRGGVGDLRSDVHAYGAHGIPAILLCRRAPDGLPPGTRCAPGWREILEMIR